MTWDSIERDFRRFMFTFARFLTTRFPFWEAISTAMLLGEWGEKSRVHQIPDAAIYAHIGVCLLLGSIMSFDQRKQRVSALFSAGQMMCMALLSIGIWKSYGHFIVLKIFSRYLGICSGFLLLSGGFADFRAVHKRYIQLGHFFLGITLFIEAYLLYSWTTERNVFINNLPYQIIDAQKYMPYIFCFLLCLCGFCFITSTNLQSGSKCALALWIVIVMLTNLNYTFWTGHVELWTHFRIIAGDLSVMSSFAVIYAMT